MSDSQHTFSENYNLYINEIYRYIFYLVYQQQEIAEDLTSITFIKALESYNPKRSSVRTFLFRVAKNTVIDYYRKHTPELLSDEELDKHSAQQPHADQKTDIQLFWKKAQSLLEPDAYELLILRYKNDLSIEEIGETTERSEDAVKSSLKRSKQLLSEYYGT